MQTLFLQAYHAEFTHQESPDTMLLNDHLYHIERMIDNYLTGQHNANIDYAHLPPGKKPKKPKLSDKFKVEKGETYLSRLRTERWKNAVGYATMTKLPPESDPEVQALRGLEARIKASVAANNKAEA